MTDEHTTAKVVIETRPVTITIEGVGATADAAFALWERTMERLALRELESASFGFASGDSGPMPGGDVAGPAGAT